MNSSFHMTELDEKLYDGTAQMLKAAIPMHIKNKPKHWLSPRKFWN